MKTTEKIKNIFTKGKVILYFLDFLNLKELLRLSACNSFLFKTIKSLKSPDKLSKLHSQFKLNYIDSLKEFYSIFLNFLINCDHDISLDLLIEYFIFIFDAKKIIFVDNNESVFQLKGKFRNELVEGIWTKKILALLPELDLKILSNIIFKF
jgi:hypothetical protein